VPDLTVRARRVVTSTGERRGAVLVQGGRIHAITEPDDPAAREPAGRVVDVPDDCVLLPGLVDSHVHVNEPGRTDWEGFRTATAAAAAGGVTTIVDMPLNSIPPTVDVDALATKRAAADGQLAVDVAFWGGAVPGNVEQLRPLYELGVVGFKCFLLPSGVDEFPPLDADQLRTAMARIASFGGLLIAHAEDAAVVDANAHGIDATYASFLASRPESAETAAIDRLLAATRETGCRTHIVHLSAASAIPAVAAARAEGLPLTVETCPHYLTLAAEQIPDGATQYKCCPPIREAANRDQLWDALAAGVIDCVVSDHSPCPVDMKRFDVGDFGLAWGGIASVQVSLPAVWTEASDRGFELSDVVRWMGRRTAQLVDLPGRGDIAPGFRADFAVFAPDQTFVVDPATLRHKNPVSAYGGRQLRGVVRTTLLAGEPVDLSDGTPRRGRLVERGAA
jgi:allantoinase